MLSSGSRSTWVRFSEPLSFQASTFGGLRPLGYSGVSATQRRPRSSQSRAITFRTSGSAATSDRLKSGWTSRRSVAFDGCVGPSRR